MNWVSANRPGLMSALVKSMRMGKANHAAYWVAVLLEGGLNPWYVAQRVFISASEDGIAPDTLEVAFRNLTDDGRTVETTMAAAMAVALGPKWYDSRWGQDLIHAWLKAHQRSPKNTLGFTRSMTAWRELMDEALQSGPLDRLRRVQWLEETVWWTCPILDSLTDRQAQAYWDDVLGYAAAAAKKRKDSAWRNTLR
ncbi:MAG: hypothetical protein ACYC9Q_12285 [Bacillota bacterium]